MQGTKNLKRFALLYNKKMEKSIQITLIIVAAFVVLALIGMSQLSSQNTVTGNGQAQIKAMPDLVAVYFNVETKGETASEAKDKNSEIVDDMITAILKLGFERKDITTQNFNVYPNYNWKNGEQEIDGYIASHSLRLEMPTDDSDEIGEVIDAGIDAGAGISYINFELSQEKQNSYKAEALKLATEDAKIKAESIASGLGKELGRLVSVSSSNFDYYPWRLYDAVGAANVEEAKTATTNIQPGEQEISAAVIVVYKLR